MNWAFSRAPGSLSYLSLCFFSPTFLLPPLHLIYPICSSPLNFHPVPVEISLHHPSFSHGPGGSIPHTFNNCLSAVAHSLHHKTLATWPYPGPVQHLLHSEPPSSSRLGMSECSVFIPSVLSLLLLQASCYSSLLTHIKVSFPLTPHSRLYLSPQSHPALESCVCIVTLKGNESFTDVLKLGTI